MAAAGAAEGTGSGAPADGGAARLAAVDNIRPVLWSDGAVVFIDQRRLPLQEVDVVCTTWEEVAEAICNMTVRGAPLIGATAAYGMCLAIRDDPSDVGLAAGGVLPHSFKPRSPLPLPGERWRNSIASPTR